MKQIGYKVPIGHTGPKIKKKGFINYLHYSLYFFSAIINYGPSSGFVCMDYNPSTLYRNGCEQAYHCLEL